MPFSIASRPSKRLLKNTSARCSFSATNTSTSPPWGRMNRLVMKSSSASRGSRSAFPSSLRRASVRSNPHYSRQDLADLASDLSYQDLPGTLGRLLRKGGQRALWTGRPAQDQLQPFRERARCQHQPSDRQGHFPIAQTSPLRRAITHTPISVLT